jgi:hypothetical protein
MSILGQGVDLIPFGECHLPHGGDHLSSNGASRIRWIHQTGKIGGDLDTKTPGGRETFYFLRGKVDYPSEILNRIEAVRKLPPPVFPLRERYIAPRMRGPSIVATYWRI